MSGGNSYKYRPEVQARKLADLNNLEVQRRKAMLRKARGQKKRLIVDWNVAWNVAGRPKDFPDFDVWLGQNKTRLDARRKEELESQRRINKAHADWIASLSDADPVKRAYVERQAVGAA